MNKPDHAALMHRYQAEAHRYLAESDGRPTPSARLYGWRKAMKRWSAERDGFQVQLDEIRTQGRSVTAANDSYIPVGGYTDPSYAKARLRELDEKLTLASKLDLRTDEERRGVHRQYVRSPLTEAKVADGLSHWTNEEYLALQKKQRAQAARMRRYHAECERKASVLGSPERLERYLWLRDMLTPDDDRFRHAQAVQAERAIATKVAERESLPPPPAPTIGVNERQYIEALAKLADLDKEYADVAAGCLGHWPHGSNLDQKRRRKKPKPNQNPPEGTDHEFN